MPAPDTLEQYLASIGCAPKKRSKYGNIRTTLDGHQFDSKVEANYYAKLIQRQLAGEVSEINIHPRWPIEINGVKVCVVEMDFSFLDHRTLRVHVVDVKGFDTAISKLKRKLLLAVHGVKTEVVKK